MDVSTTVVLAGFLLAVLVSALTTPVGVSGAVFLLPVQVSVLHIPSPSVTPTNLMYNLFATPAALVTYWRQGQVDPRLARVLLVGTIPGVVVGAWLRVEHLSGALALRLLLGLFLIPIGVLLLRRRDVATTVPEQPLPRWLGGLAGLVGVFGGLIGVGGGSVLAPVLASLGLPLVRVAPAALLTTLVTSVVGVATFALLAVTGEPAAAPDWLLGVALGLGGMVGGVIGARAQPHLPERALRRFLALAALLVGATYVVTALALR